jgi:hypothetical protein
MTTLIVLGGVFRSNGEDVSAARHPTVTSEQIINNREAHKKIREKRHAVRKLDLLVMAIPFSFPIKWHLSDTFTGMTVIKGLTIGWC